MVEADDKLDMLNLREDKSIVKSLDPKGKEPLIKSPSCSAVQSTSSMTTRRSRRGTLWLPPWESTT